MFEFLFRMSDDKLTKRYIDAGSQVGDAVSYTFMGECCGMESMVERWAKLEKRYATRGYRTISLDRFTSYGGYGKSLSDVEFIKREEGEEPIFHAEI